MVDLKFLLLSICSYVLFNYFFRNKRVNFILSHIPFILCLFSIDQYNEMILYGLAYSIVVFKNRDTLINNYNNGLFCLTILWSIVFMMNVSTVLSFCLVVILVTIIQSFFIMKHEDYLLSKYNSQRTFLYYFIVIVYFVLLYSLSQLGNTSFISNILHSILIFLLLNNFDSETQYFQQVRAKKKEMSMLVDFINLVTKPIVFLYYIMNTGIIISINYGLSLVMMVLVLFLVFKVANSLRHDHREVVIYRIANLNASLIVFFFTFTNLVDITLSLLALIINYLLFNLVQYNEAIRQKPNLYRITLGLFFGAPISPVFIFKVYILNTYLALESFYALLLIVILIILPVFVYPFYRVGDSKI